MIHVLQRSAVLISVSLYEGFGLSLIEALSCGKPTFAFGGGAVQEVLDPIDPTFTVSLRDTDILIERVQAFLAFSEEERKQKGEQYRQKVIELYALKKSATALQSVYEKATS